MTDMKAPEKNHTLSTLNAALAPQIAQQDNSDFEPDHGPETEKAGHGGKTRPFWLFSLCSGLSLIWIGSCLWWFLGSDITLTRIPLNEAGGLMAGVCLPLILIWMVALVYSRTDPLRDQAGALGHNLDGLFRPLDIAERRLNMMAADLEKEIARLEAAGDIAADRIGHLEKRFQLQTSQLFDVTTDAEKKAGQLQTQLATERQALDSLMTEITDQTNTLETIFRQIACDSEAIATKTRQNAEAVTAEITRQNAALAERGQQVAEQLDQMAEHVTDQASGMTGQLEQALHNLKNQSTHLGEHSQKIISSIVSQTEQLPIHMVDIRGHLNDIQARTEKTIHSIEQATDAINQHFLATDSKAAALSQNWLKTAQLVENQTADSLLKLDSLFEKMTGLGQTGAVATQEAEQSATRVIEQMQQASESIFLASASAVEAADETNRVIDQQTEKFQQIINAYELSNKSILINAETLEKKNREKNGNQFSLLASTIIERLQSLSIDINRYFEEDIPDKFWQSYAAGDKSAFVRRLKKLSNKKYTALIRRKYQDDIDFQRHVIDYMRLFEDMMAQSMISNNYSSFSVALISSEVGRVYLALAQASERFSE